MRSHRKFSWQAPKPEPGFDTFSDTAPMRAILRPSPYPKPVFVEQIEDRDEDGKPLAIIWYSLGNDIFAGIHVNREDAQDIVTSLRAAFPPEMSFGPEPDFPGIK